MHKMFNGAFLFAGPANLNWNTAKVTDMSYMFETAKQFNSDIANWVRFHLFFCCCFHCFQYHSNQIFSLTVFVVLLKDTSRVGSMHKMFEGAELFAGPAILNWNTAKVTDMSHMFDSAKQFNSDIANWVRFHLFFCCCFHCFQYHSNQIFSLAVFCRSFKGHIASWKHGKNVL